MDVLSDWYAAVRDGRIHEWPRVVYYLMGANEWRAASDWPLPDTADEDVVPGRGRQPRRSGAER